MSFNPFRSQYFNIGLTRARGAELAVDVAPVERAARRAAATRSWRREILESTSPTNAVFSRGPVAVPSSAALRFRLDQRGSAIGVLLDLSGTFVGRRVDSDFSLLARDRSKTTGYALWDLRAAYRLRAG